MMSEKPIIEPEAVTIRNVTLPDFFAKVSNELSLDGFVGVLYIKPEEGEELAELTVALNDDGSISIKPYVEQNKTPTDTQRQIVGKIINMLAQ